MNEAERNEQYARWSSSAFGTRVITTWVTRSYKINELNFCQKFSDLQDRFEIFRTIFWDLWRGLPKGVAVDPEIIKSEVTHWLGKEKIDEAIVSSTEDYDEFLQQVQDLFDALTKEYYSGFIGKMLQKWDNLRQGKPQTYKKLN